MKKEYRNKLIATGVFLAAIFACVIIMGFLGI